MHNIKVQRLKRFFLNRKAKKHKHAAENRCQKLGLTPHPQNTLIPSDALHQCRAVFWQAAEVRIVSTAAASVANHALEFNCTLQERP